MVTVFDQDLFIEGEFTYYCEDMGMGPAGWYNDAGELCNNLPLGGTGRGVQIGSDAAKFMTAGQVAQGNSEGKIVIDNLNVGFTMICNPTPITLDIQDFVPAGDSVGWGAEIITMYDEDLFIDGEYTYYCEDMGMGDAGWYNDAGKRVTVDIPAGYGFNIQTGGDCTIEVPSAFAK